MRDYRFSLPTLYNINFIWNVAPCGQSIRFTPSKFQKNLLPLSYTGFVPVAQQPNWGPRRLIFDASISHTIRHTHTHTHTHTHARSRTPLDERSARRKGRYLHNTQQTQQTNNHALSGIRTCDLSNLEARKASS
jgi:hypothetical protein